MSMIQERCRGKRFAVGSHSLLRNLKLREAVAIVVGIMIGTGVFLKTSVMAQQVGSPSAVLLAWLAAGVLSLVGALTYAEISALFPSTGGEYVYLREAYGRLPAFLFGWTRFWIITPGSIAAFSAGAATFIDAMIDLGDFKSLVALSLLLAFTVLNCFSVSFTGRVQTVLTAIKIFMIVGLTSAIFVIPSQATFANLSMVELSAGWMGWPAFGSAVLAALWAFDGWNNLSLTGGEVSNPQRTLPMALAGGTLLVFLIYAAVNLAYFYALPFAEVLNASSTLHPNAQPVATKAAAVAMGPLAVHALSVMFVLSAIGAMNGSILTGARVPYAMAMDGLFFKSLKEVSETSRVPVVSVLVQGGIATGLVLLGTFDQLTDYVIFASWIFYAAVGASLFVFRKRFKTRDFQVPGYPWLPGLFVGASVLLLINTLFTAPKESGIGVAMIAAGVPVFFYFRSRK